MSGMIEETPDDTAQISAESVKNEKSAKIEKPVNSAGVVTRRRAKKEQ